MMEDLTIDKEATPQFPLVSVVVVTYNSSATVLETLESIKSQTYKNIELIVTDDCSKDDTIEVVRKWLERSCCRFDGVELMTTEKNTGVSGNINRGIRKSHGAWIKTIAGDDLLIPTAIEEYMSFVRGNHDGVKMCVCDVEPFAINAEVPLKIIRSYKNYFEFEKEAYEEQRKRVMCSLVFVGPAFFYSRELFDEIGGFSEKYGNAEEWPFVYKIIMGGNRIYTIEKKLVRYRVQAESLCHTIEGELSNKNVFMGMYRHYFDRPVKDLIREGRILTAWHFSLFYWSRRLQYHVNNSRLRKSISTIFFIFSPLAYMKKIGL